MSPRRTPDHEPPMGAADITKAMLPAPGSEWRDTYNSVPRTAIVESVSPYGKLQGVDVWLVNARETHGFQRTFHIMAHGFLSRYELIGQR